MQKYNFGIANFMIEQNAAILERMHAEPVHDLPGIYENGQGQIIYVDVNGDSHPLHSPYEDLNGWTI